MKYHHIIVIKEWSDMNDVHEMEWLDSTYDAGWELISSQFIKVDHTDDAPRYLTPDKYVFRYVFRTPSKS